MPSPKSGTVAGSPGRRDGRKCQECQECQENSLRDRQVKSISEIVAIDCHWLVFRLFFGVFNWHAQKRKSMGTSNQQKLRRIGSHSPSGFNDKLVGRFRMLQPGSPKSSGQSWWINVNHVRPSVVRCRVLSQPHGINKNGTVPLDLCCDASPLPRWRTLREPLRSGRKEAIFPWDFWVLSSTSSDIGVFPRS